MQSPEEPHPGVGFEKFEGQEKTLNRATLNPKQTFLRVAGSRSLGE